MSLFQFNFKNKLLISLFTLICVNALNLHSIAICEARHAVIGVTKHCLKVSKKAVENEETVHCARDFAMGILDPVNGKLGDAQAIIQVLYSCFSSAYYCKKTYAHELMSKDLALVPNALEPDIQMATTTIKRWMVIGADKIKMAPDLNLTKIQALQKSAILEEQRRLDAENKKAEALAKARLKSASSALDYFGNLKDLPSLAHTSQWKLNLVDTLLVPRADVCCERYFYQHFGMLYGVGLLKAPTTSVMQFKFKLDPSEIESGNSGLAVTQKLDLLNVLIKYSLIESHTAMIDLNWLMMNDFAQKDQLISAVIKQIEQHAEKRSVTKFKLYIPATCHAELKLLNTLGYKIIDSILNVKVDYAVMGYIVQRIF